MENLVICKKVLPLPDRRYLTIDEVCQYCNISRSVLQIWEQEIADFLSLLSSTIAIATRVKAPSLCKRFYSRAEAVRLKKLCTRVFSTDPSSNQDSAVASIRHRQFIVAMRSEVAGILQDIKNEPGTPAREAKTRPWR